MIKRFVISVAVTAFAFLGLLACNSVERHSSSAAPVNAGTSGSNSQHADGARRITTAELKDLIDKGQAYVVDVRTEASYKAGRIKGAVFIPYKEVGNRIKELPRDKTIVTYCS